MTKKVDMQVFLDGVLSGSHATRKRHLLQARVIQEAIAERWQRESPWRWKQKHLIWFIEHRMNNRSTSTKYYYLLTIRLLVRRLGKPWIFGHQPHHLLGSRYA